MVVRVNGIGMIEDADGGNHFRFIAIGSGHPSRCSNTPAAARRNQPDRQTHLVGYEWRSTEGERFSWDERAGGGAGQRLDKTGSQPPVARIVHVYWVQGSRRDDHPGETDRRAEAGISQEQVNKQAQKYMAEVEQAGPNTLNILSEVSRYEGADTIGRAYADLRYRNRHAIENSSG